MRILFVTRKYPPSTGGMENAAFELHRALAHVADTRLIHWGGSNKYLPVVYPWLTIRALLACWTFRPDVVYLQDGLMSPLGWVVQTFGRRPTIMTIHGLEVTHKGTAYRQLVLPWIRRQTNLVAISEETKQAISAALPGVEAVMIHNGVRDVFQVKVDRTESMQVIANAIDREVAEIANSRILYSNGRLVKRKGAEWFVSSVMPKLLKQYDKPLLYLISGTGPEQEAIQAAIHRHGLESQVYLLGRVSDELRDVLYTSADIFIMPNIPIHDDMEGFGLVALEAASCGTTVIASNLEGLSDAIVDKENGLLVKPKDAEAYVSTIIKTLHKPTLKTENIRNYTLEHYSWDTAARRYVELMQTVVAAQQKQ